VPFADESRRPDRCRRRGRCLVLPPFPPLRSSTDEQTAEARFRLELEALPGDVPVARRLAQALKHLLRAHGLRCVMASEIKQPEDRESRSHGRGAEQGDGMDG
jgi:hypothetical protein